MNILYLNKTDLFGRRFNGFDLHLQFREMGHAAWCFVQNKTSNDDTTFIHSRDLLPINNETFSGTGCELTELLVSRPQFLDADILHMHLFYNNGFDFHLLPLLTKLKPVVWTLHDPWLMGGHCIHPGECDKWKTHCHDCTKTNKSFPLDVDRTAFQFAAKKMTIQHSQLDFVVASEWMRKQVEASPILAGKRIHEIPFGIDQRVFKPGNTVEVRRKLNISEGSKVLFLRQQRAFKRPDIIRKAMDGLRRDHEKITVLVVGTDDEFYPSDDTVSVRYFGWVTDDQLLVELYQACDLFLMPSDHEAFGIMAVEAMSCGKTVLVLKGTALPAVVNSPECGLATTDGEYERELRRLLLDPGELRQRGQKSLEYVKTHYAQDTYLERILNLYEDVIRRFTLTTEARLILDQLQKYSHNAPCLKENSTPKKMLYVVAPRIRRSPRREKSACEDAK